MTDNVLADLEPLLVPIDRVSLLPGNPRRGDIDAVAASLTKFGQHKQIVARRLATDERSNATGVVLAGNHTLAAAQQLGWDHIAVVWTDDDEITGKARALADNHTAELGSYDDEALVAMLSDVAVDPELLAATAYSDDDLMKLLNTGEGLTDPDDVPNPLVDPVTQPRDVWLLGEHRVMCGDCRDNADVDHLIGDAKINVAVTSPPYASQREYDQSSGFKPVHPDIYVEWFEPAAEAVKDRLTEDGSWFINVKPLGDGLDTHLYVMDLVIAHVRQWGWHFATEFCWERNGVPKSVAQRFKNQFEPIYQFVLAEWKMRPDEVRHWSENVPIAGGPEAGNMGWIEAQGSGIGGALPSHRKTDGSIAPGMAYPGNRLPTFSGSHMATGHTASFPVGLPTFFIKAYSDSEDNIYDPFMGSGSTLIAAHNEKRIAYGMEISPAYVDVICKRFEQHTGITPVLEGTGPRSFVEQEDRNADTNETAGAAPAT